MKAVPPRLQVVCLWQRQVIAYRLLNQHDSVSIGSAKRVTFVLPLPPGYPLRLRLLRPIRDGFRLRLGPGISGDLVLRGQSQDVGTLLAGPAPKRLLGGGGMFREVDLFFGDSAHLVLEGPSDLRLAITFTDPPPIVGSPPGWRAEPVLVRVGAATALVTAALLAVVLLLGGSLPSATPVLLTAERVARLTAPTPAIPPAKDLRAIEKAAEEARKKKEREAAMSKRHKDEEGRLGRADTPNKDTVLPKGREDVLREKVAKTGLLAALGTLKAPGSGLGKLLDTNSQSDVDQALNGLVGAQMVAGKGSGGLGNAGTGLGGGGTGFGRISGSGDLDLGAGRGRGKKSAGVGLAHGKEREVQVGMTTGNPNSEGGLTKDQINRVVRAHAAAVRYCYEKELQRAPKLEGKIEVFWVIRTNGTVDRTKIASSGMGSLGVESCIERQVKQWQFPKSDAETIVQSYPFLFKGGS